MIKPLFQLVVILFIGLSFNLFSQSEFGSREQIDSLHQVFKWAEHDTTKLYVTLELSYQHSKYDRDSALFYANKGHLISQNGIQLEDDQLTINRLIELSALCIEATSDYHRLNKSYHQAIEFYKKCIKEKKRINMKGCAFVYNKMSICHIYLSDYSNALEIAYLALDESDLIQNKTPPESVIEYQSLNIVSSVHARVENWQKAIEYYEKSLTIVDNITHNRAKSNLLNNLAKAYQRIGELETSIDYYSQALAEVKNLKKSEYIVFIQTNMASCYIEMALLTEAEILLNKASVILGKLNNKEASAAFNCRMAELSFANNNFSQAKEYAIRVTKDNSGAALELTQIATQLLVDLAEQEKNWKAAYEYTQQLELITDSIVNLDKQKVVLDIESKHNIQKLENLSTAKLTKKQQDLQKASVGMNGYRSKHQQQLLISLLLGICTLIIGIGGFFWYRSDKRKNLKKEREAELKVKSHLKRINVLSTNLNQQLIEKISIDPDIINQNLKRLTKTSLTKRELNVLVELCKGKENKQIAESLFISVNTVRTHLLNIYEKMDVNSRIQAIKKAENLNRLTLISQYS